MPNPRNLLLPSNTQILLPLLPQNPSPPLHQPLFLFLKLPSNPHLNLSNPLLPLPNNPLPFPNNPQITLPLSHPLQLKLPSPLGLLLQNLLLSINLPPHIKKSLNPFHKTRNPRNLILPFLPLLKINQQTPKSQSPILTQFLMRIISRKHRLTKSQLILPPPLLKLRNQCRVTRIQMHSIRFLKKFLRSLINKIQFLPRRLIQLQKLLHLLNLRQINNLRKPPLFLFLQPNLNNSKNNSGNNSEGNKPKKKLNPTVRHQRH